MGRSSTHGIVTNMNWKKEIFNINLSERITFINSGHIYIIGIPYKSLTPSELIQIVANHKDNDNYKKEKGKKHRDRSVYLISVLVVLADEVGFRPK
jgi:hypothetical protein